MSTILEKHLHQKEEELSTAEERTVKNEREKEELILETDSLQLELNNLRAELAMCQGKRKGRIEWGERGEGVG